MPFDGAFTLEDKQVSKHLLTLWTDFVKTGKEPCGCWTPLTQDNQQRLEIGTKGLNMIPIDEELHEFWINNIWPKLIGNLAQKSDKHNQMYIFNKDEL